ANALSGAKGSTKAGERYSIHDLIVNDIDDTTYKGFGSFALIVSTMPQLKDVRIDHVTAFPTRVLISFLNSSNNPKIANLSVTNSIFAASRRQISSAGGGPGNCAFRAEQLQPDGVLKNCVINPVFSHNVIVGGTGKWPADNLLVKQADEAQFLGRGHSREGGAGSAGVRVGSDGRNIGADSEAVERATEGVM